METLRSRGQGPESERLIFDEISRAIADRRLSAGMKLPEAQLADIFGVSRACARSALHALAREKLVTLQLNRGAFVSKPSTKEAREVFEARKMLETAVARKAAGLKTPDILNSLRRQVHLERLAEGGTDRAAYLRISHDFHLLIARQVGNAVVVDILRELLFRSSLVTAIYERQHTDRCSHECHSGLVDILEHGTAEEFAAAMLIHLEEIEGELDFEEATMNQADLRTIFTNVMADR